jgi:DNA replication licensing factor MCM3
VAHLFATSLRDEEEFFFSEFLEKINEGLGTDELFGTTEATVLCEEMQEMDELMISDGIVYKV